MATQQPIVAWTGEHTGQTLDSTHSFAIADCDDTGTLMLFGHLYRTNQPNAPFLVYYRLDAGAPVLTQGSYTTSADGTGDFAFSVKGMTSGSHAVIPEINFGPNGGLTYYMNPGGTNSVGIPFTSPCAASQLGGQSLVPWSGTNKGQTLDSTHSFATPQCDDSHTLIVFGHLSQTNQPNAPFWVYYKLDTATVPVLVQGSYTTRADGTGDFAFSVEGIPSGTHTVVLQVNFGSYPGLTYYMNSSGPDNVGIPFTCP